MCAVVTVEGFTSSTFKPCSIWVQSLSRSLLLPLSRAERTIQLILTAVRRKSSSLKLISLCQPLTALNDTPQALHLDEVSSGQKVTALSPGTYLIESAKEVSYLHLNAVWLWKAFILMEFLQ